VSPLGKKDYEELLEQPEGLTKEQMVKYLEKVRRSLLKLPPTHRTPSQLLRQSPAPLPNSRVGWGLTRRRKTRLIDHRARAAIKLRERALERAKEPPVTYQVSSGDVAPEGKRELDAMPVPVESSSDREVVTHRASPPAPSRSTPVVEDWVARRFQAFGEGPSMSGSSRAAEAIYPPSRMGH
jgi:hypothetical protein